jgi:23S rRNA pseudouridine2605 synthase
MPLNKYVSRSGEASRREAASFVKEGRVKVNDEVMINPAYEVQEGDIIKLDDKVVSPEDKKVYLLLNKPKDFITTLSDEKGRKTVLDLVSSACEERIFPVGRLDRNTTGLLLLTNDGELAQKLSHPKNNVQKLYQVNLDKPLSKPHYTELLGGVELEDGLAQADQLEYIDAADKSKIGIQIHSGKNRIVRRLFEHFGYEVKQLDRVMYAQLTKKNLPRGKYRFLSEQEVRYLKFFK